MAMRISRALANVQMRVKDLENESIPYMVSFLELIEDDKFYYAWWYRLFLGWRVFFRTKLDIFLRLRRKKNGKSRYFSFTK